MVKCGLPLFYVVNKNNKELPAYRNNTLGSTPTSTTITRVQINTHSVPIATIYSCTVEA